MKEKKLSSKLCHYVWDVLIAMNRGYGFNASHTLGYSIMGLQEANLAYHYPIIYWNTANLISDSGGEDGNVNYEKIASAIGNIQKEGVKVVLPSVNRAKFGFYPDAKNNEIVYGLKGISGIGTKVAKAIIDNQTYDSMWDFYNKMQVFKNEDKENKFGDTAMITLIKAGAFDEVENRPRVEIMADFIRYISSPIKSLKMANIVDLKELGLLTEAQIKYELRLFNFRKYVYQKKFFVKQTGKSATTAYYRLERKFAEPYFYENFENDMAEGKDYEFDEKGFVIVKKGSLDRVFDKLTKDFRETVLTSEDLLDKVNQARFDNLWKEKAPGTVPKWEMESMNFYYTGHELAHVNTALYNIENFFDHSPEAEISGTYMFRGVEKPRFKLWRIAGTVIGRDKNKNVVTLLTTTGVVQVKFYKGQFNFYDKKIVEVNENGEKTLLENSWFQRGSLLLVTGYRREDQFIPRKYVDSVFKHSLQLINGIREDGSLILQSERAGQEEL